MSSTGWQVQVLREAERQGRLHELVYLVVVNFPGWLAFGEPEQVWEEYPGVAVVFPLVSDRGGALAQCSVYCRELSVSYAGLGLVFRPFLQSFEDAARFGVEFVWSGKNIDYVDPVTGEVYPGVYTRQQACVLTGED
jgi:hypothetical protein